MEPSLFTVAHISDLHFSKVQYGLSQFFSKRWIGNLNLLFKRGKQFKNAQPFTLLNEFIERKVTHVFISGDLSTTSSKKEFKMAKTFIGELEKNNMKVFLIPGNHDAYTKRSFRKKTFYKSLKEYMKDGTEFSLKNDQVTGTYLGKDFWLVRIDTAFPSPFYLSAGKYTEEIDHSLNTLLKSIPNDHKIFVMNHFPLFHYEHPKRILLGAEMLRETLSKYPNILFYLHGHTHSNTVADLRKSTKLPIILDSGSASHNTKGSWNLLAIEKNSCKLDVFFKTNTANWTSIKTTTFRWDDVETTHS